MAHSDIIVDSGSYFKIKPDTREIIRVDDTPLTLVQGDHNSERVSFSIPRYVDGHDMSICSRVEVHYRNVDSTNKDNVSEDVYIVNDLIANVENDTAEFTWLIYKSATMYNGTLAFSIHFICFEEDDKVAYMWNTGMYKGGIVKEGCSCNATESENFEDLFASWEKATKGEIQEYIDNCVEVMSKELEENVISPAPLKTFKAILVTNKEYNVGEVTELSIVFPTIASDGDVIYLTFKSGDAATTLTIDTTNTSDIEIIPEANCYYDIFAKFNGHVWLVNYSEYLVSEV